MRRITRIADLNPNVNAFANQQFVDLQKPDGGFSFNPVHGTTPDKQFMVALHPSMGGNEHIIHSRDITPQHITNHQNESSDILNDPNVFQGGWHNPENGQVYLDVSKQFDTLTEAAKEAVKHKQLAVFDNKKG